jgi:hypothetical protein
MYRPVIFCKIKINGNKGKRNKVYGAAVATHYPSLKNKFKKLILPPDT